MIKKNIETFIKKYHLGGTIDSAVWMNDGDDLTVTAVTPSKRLFASVRGTGLAKGFVDGVSVGVLVTERLKKQITPLADNVALSLDIDENDATRVRKIKGDDGQGYSFEFVCNELSTMGDMGVVPKIKSIPSYDVEISITPEFVEKYVKALSSVQTDDTLFTLIMSKQKQKLELVLNWKPKLNSDRCILSVDATPGKDKVKNPISFNAKMLKDIFAANDDFEKAVLGVSEQGISGISFDKDGIKSQYYLVKIDVED
jgi:hypothetical protein